MILHRIGSGFGPELGQSLVAAETAPHGEAGFLISADDDPFLGDLRAPVTIVAFSDFTCSHCREARQTLDRVLPGYGDRVRLVYRDFPLQAPGSPSFTAALAAECADEQGAYWEMQRLLFENQPHFDWASVRRYARGLSLNEEQFDDCLENERFRQEILDDQADGQAYGVTGTPTFFVNGRRYEGSISDLVFQQAIEDALSRG
jgi:protein-disulfide isomerase